MTINYSIIRGSHKAGFDGISIFLIMFVSQLIGGLSSV